MSSRRFILHSTVPTLAAWHLRYVMFMLTTKNSYNGHTTVCRGSAVPCILVREKPVDPAWCTYNPDVYPCTMYYVLCTYLGT